MPEIEINGEKKKVACGPCIRGHRSSKCTHKDRVLIEVRKPGRPLSACPHPTGTCSCERVVINYAVPKTTDCACSSSQASGSNRVQKPRGRKPSSSITPSTVEKALSEGSSNLAATLNGDEKQNSSEQTGTPKSYTGPSAPNESDAGSSNANGQEDNVQQHGHVSASNSPQANQAVPRSKLRLGMFGIGGYRAPDNIGWSEAYPDVTNIPFEVNGVSRHLTGSGSHDASPAPAISQADAPVQGSCCSGGASSNHSSAQAVRQHLPNGSQSNGAHAHYNQPPTQSQYSYQPATVPQLSNGAARPASSQSFMDPGMTRFSENQQTFFPVSVAPSCNGISMAVNHECSCGDSCMCFGCPTHPQNLSTTEYVKSLHDFMDSEESATLFQNYHGNSYGMENQIFPNMHSMQTQWQPAMPPQPTPTNELANFHLRQDMTQNGTRSSPTMRRTVSTGMTPQTAGAYTSHDSPSSQAVTTPSQYDNGSPQASEETPTLSPSSFFVQSYTLPGCNDTTGTCHCGDGCQCIGCLTHSGHQTPAPTPAFNNFQTGIAAHGPGCACPSHNMSTASHHATPSPAPLNLHQSQTPSRMPPSVAPSIHSPISNGFFTQIHGPTCACPSGTVTNAVVNARAKVQAHAELHGPNCRCPAGAQFVQAQVNAEAEVHSRMHGPTCACPGVGSTAVRPAEWTRNGLGGAGVG